MELIEFVELHHSSFNSINPTNSTNPMFSVFSACFAVNDYHQSMAFLISSIREIFPPRPISIAIISMRQSEDEF